MHVFYALELNQQKAVLTEAESKHCLRVLRKKIGDVVQCTDGNGRRGEGRIISTSGKHCTIAITLLTEDNPPPYQLHLIVSPTKNIARMEWMVEKCVELGLSSLQIAWSKHSQRKKIKVERLQKKALSAMKQSQQALLPDFPTPAPLQTVLQQDLKGALWVAHCRKERERNNWFQIAKPRGIHRVFIGPEGDFSEDELGLILSKGVLPIHLGSRRLRTETAAVLCAASLYQKSVAQL